MKKFREGEVHRSPQLKKYVWSPRQEAAKPKLNYFLPFFQERDGIGRLISEEDERIRFRTTTQTPAAETARKKRILKDIYQDYVSYHSPRSQTGQRARDDGHENMSSTQQKFMQSHAEDFLSDERMDTIPYTTMYSPKFQRMKIEKPAKAQYLNQGSKFRLTSRKASENFHHYLGSYDTTRAVELISKKKPQVIIFKKHEKPTTPQYTQARRMKRQKFTMSADTNGSQAQQSDNIQQDLYRLLHSNNSGTRPTGASIKNALFRFSFKTIPETEQLLKFNNVMTQSIEDMRKELVNFRVKLNAVSLKSHL